MTDTDVDTSSTPTEPRLRRLVRRIVALAMVMVLLAGALVWWLGSAGATTALLNLAMFVMIGGAMAIPALLLARYTRPDEPWGVRSTGLFVEGLRGERDDHEGRHHDR